MCPLQSRMARSTIPSESWCDSRRELRPLTRQTKSGRVILQGVPALRFSATTGGMLVRRPLRPHLY
jgi:hypothetical protein